MGPSHLFLQALGEKPTCATIPILPGYGGRLSQIPPISCLLWRPCYLIQTILFHAIPSLQVDARKPPYTRIVLHENLRTITVGKYVQTTQLHQTTYYLTGEPSPEISIQICQTIIKESYGGLNPVRFTEYLNLFSVPVACSAKFTHPQGAAPIHR